MNFAIPPNCRCSMCQPPFPWRNVLIVCAALLGCMILSLSGCATVKTCVEPLTAQAISDGAAVLVCAQTKPLAACEDAQLSVEEQQLSADTLVCAETAVAAAVNQAHTAGK